MEALLLEIRLQLPPQALFAMVGGILGAWTLAKPRRDGYPVSAIFIAFGVACAMVVSDYLLVVHENKLLAAHFAIGMPSGAIMGAVMMAIRAVSPTMAANIVNVVDKAAAGLSESRLLKAISILFGKSD